MATATTDEETTGPRAAGDGPPAPVTRVNVGELVSAASALLLLAVMFATEWYGVAGVPDPSVRPARRSRRPRTDGTASPTSAG